MSDQQQRPPYPPAPPYPPQGVPQPPRPVGMPPHVPGMKMPVGVKMPPRPMGYPVPGGVKMPPRPAGVPPMGMYPPAAVVPQAPVPVPEETPQEEEWENNAAEPDVDENGYIDDLPEISEEEEEEEDLQEIGHRKNNDDEDPYKENMASDLGLPPVFIKTKMLMLLFFLFFALGGGAGYLMSSVKGKSDDGMRGVVRNAEIPKGRPRCGIAQKGQGCVLYLMNAQRREIEGRDFFETAANLLNVPRFQIETANIRYATIRIPPGYIALLNIPPTQ